MKTTSLALAATLLAGTALAQSTTTTPTRPTPGASAPGATSNAPIPGVNSSTGVTPNTGVVDRNAGTAAASGDRNQAVTTTTANAPQPARGSNSFTQGEAGRRLESAGFRNVNNLHKDDGGVWRGTGTKDGQPAQVWLDYKGNTGQEGGMANAGAPAGTAVGRATERTLGTNTTGMNSGARNLDGTTGNQPGTTAGRAIDRTLGTNTTGANPGGSNTGVSRQ